MVSESLKKTHGPISGFYVVAVAIDRENDIPLMSPQPNASQFDNIRVHFDWSYRLFIIVS